MAGFSVKISQGFQRAQQELGALETEIKAAASEAVNQVGDLVAAHAIDTTTRKYNLEKDDLEPYVYVRRGGVGALHVSVELQVKAIPIELFQPRVRMVSVRMMVFGRYRRTRLLPAIEIKRYRNRGYKLLYPYFPLHTRQAGALPRGDRIRRRVGSSRSGRGERRDGSYGAKLTGVRYYTFPRSFAERELLPKAKSYGEKQLIIQFREAYRSRAKSGLKVLRLNG